ncbi:MAG: glycosyltransferase family 1 protein [Hyphomicrobiales bacterium]|nr:glycosyltransferase family 1 protein [Hyphomicrobiales bacterium]
MRIALITLGTRGDVQPFIALGKSLKARGHDVVVGAPDDFQTWIEGHGLAYRSIGVDMHAFFQSPEGRKVLGGNVFAMARIWSKTIVPLTRRSLDAIWKTARDAQVIVYHPKTVGAADVGEATGAALFHVAPFPMFPTTAFPLFVFSGNYGSRLNRASYKLLRLPRLFFLPTVNRWRKDVLGLRKLSPFQAESEAKTDPAGQLCAVSPTVVPGYPASELEHIQTTGYWFLDEGQDWLPDPALSAFLEDGGPPIYIGFGSMTIGDPSALAQVIVDGVCRAGVRAILATGWGAVADIDVPETIHVIKGAPHAALFRHVSAVVHHGGAGTTAAGLRAGLPTLICPLAVDQPFWGRRVFSLGCGPKPQPIKRLHRRRFAEGLIELVGTESYRLCAHEVASAIAKEDGVERAVAIIESDGQKSAVK